MQIEVKEIEPCKLSVHYVADAMEILNKRGEVLNHFKNAPVPGFRPGKANIDAIKVHYRTQIEESLKRALAEDAYHNTLFEKKIKPHGPPTFTSLLMADGKFTCEFDLHTKPNFELAPFANLEIPKPAESETETELTERMMQELRVRFGDVAPYEENDFVQAGDNVIIDYEGTIDGERVEHLCASAETVTVGKEEFSFFDQHLLGMTAGETREFEISIPENTLPSLAGKIAHMKVTLHTGSKTTPYPLDNTLAERLGMKDFDALREYIRGTATASIENKRKQAITDAVANVLVNSNQLEVPNWMALSEAQYLAHQSRLDWALLTDDDKESFLKMANRSVKLALILDRIREENPEAQLTDQEVFEVIKRNLAKTNVTGSIDDVIKQMNKTGYLQILFSRIRDEHAMDFVVKTVKLID